MGAQDEHVHTWAFIGLGNMGGPMALNLHRRLPAKDEMLVYDTNVTAAETLVEEAGGRVAVAPNIALISQRASTIITCLPNPAIAEEVCASLLDHQGSPRPDRLIIDCSTIDPITSRLIRRVLQSAGFGTFVDAPMSGGVVGARAGTLSFMVGGSEDTFRRVQPILYWMGRKVIHCGKHGTGLSAKLANNYLLAINNLATAEAMNFGVKAGLDPLILASIINSATGRNWASEVNNPVPGVNKAAPASRQYQGGFASTLMNKDLRLAITAAEQVRAPLLLSQAASDIYGKLAGDKRYANLDFSAAYDYLQRNAKAKL